MCFLRPVYHELQKPLSYERHLGLEKIPVRRYFMHVHRRRVFSDLQRRKKTFGIPDQLGCSDLTKGSDLGYAEDGEIGVGT